MKIGDLVIVLANPLIVGINGVTFSEDLNLNAPIAAQIIDNKSGLKGIISEVFLNGDFAVNTSYGEIIIGPEDLIYATKLQRAMYEN